MIIQRLKQLNLLLVDDNYRLHAELYQLLSPMFKTLTLAHDAPTALLKLHDSDIDLVMTDIELPGMDGLELIKQIRDNDRHLPIIVLSAHNDTDYLLQAANLQIDGYLTKPLNFTKLIEALQRAVNRLPEPLTSFTITQQVIYHPPLQTLHVDGEEVSLGKKECQLLELFIGHCCHTVSKEMIRQHIWPNGSASDSALKNLLSELRKKLKYPLIQNHSGRGWSLGVEKQ